MKSEEEIANEVARAGLSKSSVLIRSQEFAWFLEECVGKEMAELDKVLHDVLKPSSERDKALERWDALRKVQEWLPSQLAMFQRSLGHKVE